MAVTHARLEARAVARAHQLFALVSDQDDIAFKHPDELVFLLVPVTLARPYARRQRDEVHAELGKPRDIAEHLPTPELARLIVRWRITRARTRRCGFKIDFLHRGASSTAALGR